MMTKMIREHFNLIAKALNNVRPSGHDRDSTLKEDQWAIDVEEIASALQQTNERFDRNRFINACKEGVS